MTDIRHAADTAAQQAFRRMLHHYEKTGKWSRRLIADWKRAEKVIDRLPPEWLLDAQHDAVMAEMDELADAEGLPDVPLAAVTESEYRALWGDR